MNVPNNPSLEVIKTAVMLLQSSVCPDLTATSLIEALRSYGTTEIKPKSPETVTIKEAAEILGVTTMTISRYMKDGTLPRIEIKGKRFVRLPRQAINALLTVSEGA